MKCLLQDRMRSAGVLTRSRVEGVSQSASTRLALSISFVENFVETRCRWRISTKVGDEEDRQSSRHARESGSVLIIVMWVAFGLVSVALYFAQSMIFELRASDNRVAELEAEQAIEGAARYVTYLLAN